MRFGAFTKGWWRLAALSVVVVLVSRARWDLESSPKAGEDWQLSNRSHLFPADAEYKVLGIDTSELTKKGWKYPRNQQERGECTSLEGSKLGDLIKTLHSKSTLLKNDNKKTSLSVFLHSSFLSIRPVMLLGSVSLSSDERKEVDGWITWRSLSVPERTVGRAAVSGTTDKIASRFG